MAFDGLKTVRTQHMFHPAGVLHGGFLVYAQVDQPAGQHGVAFIHGFRDFSSGVGLEKSSSLAISMERTWGLVCPSIKMVSR